MIEIEVESMFINMSISAYADGSKQINIDVKKEKDCYTLSIAKEQLVGVKELDFAPNLFNAKTGDKGYFVYSCDCAYQTFFTERADIEYESSGMRIPVMGAVINGKTIAMIVTKMAFAYSTIIGKKGGRYYLYPKFYVDKNPYPCDIEVKVYELEEGADFNDIAKLYREYLFAHGVQPIKERKIQYPALDYSKDAPAIRIRMGWKPAPAEILHQTVENEPEMHIACSFDDVKLFIDKLIEKGVDKAELCLVGWNVSGHDGRWPQAFPVEEKLGGEKKLKELIKYAQSKNIAITCHTNSCDAYEIADNFSMDYISKDKDGESRTNRAWSGGLAYVMCPKVTYDISKDMIEKTAELGFKGLHYIDVLTIEPLKPCFDKKHPCSTEEIVEKYSNLAKLCKEKFGGFSSEGGKMYFPENLDYALYVYWSGEESPILDRTVPLWQLALNGVVLNNTFARTINYAIKTQKEKLELIENNGRPTFYCHQKFAGDSWMGNEDIRINSDEERERTAEIIAREYKEFKERSYLQEEFMTSFEYLEDEITKTVYSDGSVIITNYSNNDYKYENIIVEKQNYKLITNFVQ